MKYVKLAALTRALIAPVRTRPAPDDAPPSTKRVPPQRSVVSAPPKTVRERFGSTTPKL